MGLVPAPGGRQAEPLWFLLFLFQLLLITALILGAWLRLYDPAPFAFPYYDTLLHFLLMGPLAFFLDLAWHQHRVTLPGGWPVSSALLVTAAAASLEELSQVGTQHRTFEWLDLLANLAGLILFAWAAEFVAAERRRYPTFPAFLRGSGSDLLQFLWKMGLASLFPGTILLTLAVTRQLEFPALGLYRYDWLLLWFLIVQVLVVLFRLETVQELKTITWFHLLGLAMELFKVHAGSWSYPEPALTKFFAVPLYSGFMYASVASFLIQVWHRLHLRLDQWPRLMLVAPLGAAIYLNFFTHHFFADLRWFLILGVFFLFLRSRLTVVNTEKRRAIPLVVTFLGLGFFVWVAENIATYFGAWAYPDQLEQWRLVHLSKINSWALLGIISFILVAELKRREASQEDAVSK